MPRQLFEDAIFKLSELDPENRHGSVRFNHVHDFKRLWVAIEKIQKQWPPLPGPLLALSASRPTTIEENSDNDFMFGNKSYEFVSKWNYNTWKTAPPPAEIIISHEFVNSLLQRIDQ